MIGKKVLLFFILQATLIISVLPILAYGRSDDETQVIFDLTFEPTLVIPSDEVTVICEVVGVFSSSFVDDFERVEVGSDWIGMIGNWTIENGYLIQSEVDNFRLIFAGDSTWTNYRFKLKVKKVGTVENTLNIIFRKGYDETLSDLYLFSLRGDETKVGIYKGSGDPFQSSEWPELAKVSFQHSADIWYNILIQVYNDSIKSKIWAEGNSEPTNWLIELSDGEYEAGKIGLLCGNQAAFDDIEVYTYTSNVLIEEMSLWYKINNGTLNQLNMNSAGDEQYSATIPKQIGEANVSFYVETVDNLGNRANSETITYTVQTPPPREIPWFTIIFSTSAIIIIIAVWFAFRKGYLAIEITED